MVKSIPTFSSVSFCANLHPIGLFYFLLLIESNNIGLRHRCDLEEEFRFIPCSSPHHPSSHVRGSPCSEDKPQKLQTDRQTQEPTPLVPPDVCSCPCGLVKQQVVSCTCQNSLTGSGTLKTLPCAKQMGSVARNCQERRTSDLATSHRYH